MQSFIRLYTLSIHLSGYTLCTCVNEINVCNLMLFIRSCCLLHVHAPLTHMHLGARTARSAVKLENAHTLSAALPMYAWLLVATLHLRARGQARANVCRAL